MLAAQFPRQELTEDRMQFAGKAVFYSVIRLDSNDPLSHHAVESHVHLEFAKKYNR
jgi:hypothetical protein